MTSHALSRSVHLVPEPGRYQGDTTAESGSLRSLTGTAAPSIDDRRVLRAEGSLAEMDLPFSTLHQLLYPIREHVGRLPGEQRRCLDVVFGLIATWPPSRFMVSAAVLDLLQLVVASSGPLLLIVDQAARIDRYSAEVLTFIGRRVTDDVLVLLRHTDEGKGTSGPRGAAAVLTTQEIRIAELAARGLTNKQIGEQLFLSPRTVGTHLYNIFPKLEISSRAALRDALEAR